MAKRFFYYQTSDIIRSFSTSRPSVMLRKFPLAVSTRTPVKEALSRIYDAGHADLIVLDPDSGQVTGLLSDFERTTTLSSKKKMERKAQEILEVQQGCHAQCSAECASRGGCEDHGAADYGGDVGILCTIICVDSAGTVEQIFDGGGGGFRTEAPVENSVS